MRKVALQPQGVWRDLFQETAASMRVHPAICREGSLGLLDTGLPVPGERLEGPPYLHGRDQSFQGVWHDRALFRRHRLGACQTAIGICRGRAAERSKRNAIEQLRQGNESPRGQVPCEYTRPHFAAGIPLARRLYTPGQVSSEERTDRLLPVFRSRRAPTRGPPRNWPDGVMALPTLYRASAPTPQSISRTGFILRSRTYIPSTPHGHFGKRRQSFIRKPTVSQARTFRLVIRGTTTIFTEWESRPLVKRRCNAWTCWKR